MTSAKFAPPIAFAAAHCQRVGKTPGKAEYWSADIKAVRHNLFCKVFTDILFVEMPGELVFLAGIDAPDGLDRRINPELAQKQAEFIQFLRAENERDDATLCGMGAAFQGFEYATVGKATAAYLAARSLTHPFGVGFMDDQGQYQLLQVEPGEASGFDGIRYLSFDELGEAFADCDA
ncbi:MAG: hypothetical protein H6R10_1835 [Rhodocyclaceae bacterium]|nr:hypothetical protein [Rhodocyclaceae bacterium]